MLINVLLIALYTFSCHSLRHLVGGQINCYSCTLASRTRYGAWKQLSFLNERHALFAWASLISVSAHRFLYPAGGFGRDSRCEVLLIYGSLRDI